MPRIAALFAFCCVGLVLGACGSSSNSSSGTTPSAPAATAPAAAPGSPGAKAKTVAVTMKDTAFIPASLTVKVGQKIKWTNQDDVPHNVTSQSGPSIQSPTFSKGGTFTYSAKTAGTISYVCTIHPNMTATITVTR
jgi:plastocyanin